MQTSSKRTIKSVEELKKAISAGHREFAIALNGGLKSRKLIRINKKGFIVVRNNIDNSLQTLCEKQIMDGNRSNIGRAMELGAFYIDD